MMNNNPRHIVTGQVRLSYVNLLKPYAREGQEAKYSATILVPKTDTATKARIDAAINAAKQDGPAKWGGVIPPIVAIPVHDGDGVRPSDGMPFGEECKGHWVFTASSKIQPEIVDININPILDPTEIYSGLYARVPSGAAMAAACRSGFSLNLTSRSTLPGSACIRIITGPT